MGRRVSFHTFGCKVNFAETAIIARDLAGCGYERVAIGEAADVVVINTCSVTEEANKKCEALVRQVRRRSAEAKVVVMGCYAQLQPDRLFAHPDIDYVLGTSERFSLSQILQEHPKGLKRVAPVSDSQTFLPAYSRRERTRAFLKVQDGCDYGCSFCTIPRARGGSRSPSVLSLVERAQRLVTDGVREIVLTGVNIGDFGKQEGKRITNFLSLLRALQEVRGDVRYRISSIEPNLLHHEIISLMAQSKKFAPHLHMPLQSGADEVLKKMRRRYLSVLYERKVRSIREAMPDASIGVDVMAGFPGETMQHFLHTLHFLRALPVAYLHVFPYSPRAHTKASAFAAQHTSTEKKNRVRSLRALSAHKKRAFYTQQLGKRRQVLLERAPKTGKLFGYTDNYIRVGVTWRAGLTNRLLAMSLQKIHRDGHVEANA